MALNESALQQAATDIFYHLGDDATFYPYNGDTVTCTVHVERESQAEPDGYATKARGEQITVEGLIRVLGKLPAARNPGRAGERFVMTDDGTIYEVTGIKASDDRFVTCSVKEVV